MCREVFKVIAQRQIEGLMFHSDMADYYNFLNLKLFKDFHDRQYIEESKNFRKVKDYFISNNHQTLLLDQFIPIQHITPIEWNDKTTSDVDKNSLMLLLKQSLERYYDWENETCKIYKEEAKKLFDWHYYDSYCFINCLIDGVELEKNHITSLINDLTAVDYDYTKIEGFQYKIK